jgi:hypothetical protein
VLDKQDKADFLRLLQTVIEQKHECTAVHLETVHVHEMFGQTTVWEGNVEVFELKGHPDVEKCYAWLHRENGTTGSVLNSENVRLITVLGKRPVDSPEVAVRAAIFYDVQPVPVSENSASHKKVR